MKIAFPFLAIVGIAVLLVLNYCGGESVTPPDTTASQEEEAPPAGAGQLEEASAAKTARAEPESAAPERKELPAVPKVAPRAEVAVFRGRCVDSGGQPMTGVEAKLHAWTGNRQRMDKYLKDHDKVEWQDPKPQITTADGRFEFRVVPPPPYQVTLDLKRAGYLELNGRWSTIEPGTVKDFGDCTMVPGCTVHGRVVDESGLPRANVQVYLRHPDRSLRLNRDRLTHRTRNSARTAADGTFRMRWLTGPGKWVFDVRQEQLLSSAKIEIQAGNKERFFELKVKSKANVPSIRGIVVDPQGGPVRGARVSTDPRVSGRGWLISTKRDGSFVIERPERQRNDSPVKIVAEKRGYEFTRTEKAWPWGATGVRLVLQPGATMSVVVIDAETYKPVEDYAVRLRQHGKAWRIMSSADEGIRARGHHPHGRAELTGLRRGAYLFRIEPKGDRLCSSDFRQVHVGDGHPTEVRFDLSPPATRTLRVETSKGTAVAGTKVELMQPLGGKPVDLKTFPVRFDGSSTSRPNQALVWCEGSTSTQGEFELRGPRKQPLAVRILGPGHLPTVVRDIVLDAGTDTITAKVSIGATVHGRIQPARLLQQLKEMAGKNAHALRKPPGLKFQRDNSGGRESFPAGRRGVFPLREDGTFECAGIGPGRWSIMLVWQKATSPMSSGSHALNVGSVDNLREGERRKLDLDLSQFLFARLRGKILVNTKPRSGQIQFKSTDGGWSSAFADDEGRFTVFLKPGSHRAFVSEHSGRSRTNLFADETVAVSAGQELSLDLHINATTVRLQVLAPDGKPQPGVRLIAGTSDGASDNHLAHSDKDGLVTTRLGLGTYQLRVYPKSLADPKAMSKFYEDHKGESNALQNAMISLAELHVKPGNDEIIKIKLPAATGY